VIEKYFKFHAFFYAGMNIHVHAEPHAYSCLHTHTHTHTLTLGLILSHTHKSFQYTLHLWACRAAQPCGEDSVPAHLYFERGTTQVI
jgi:hypothetical protein